MVAPKITAELIFQICTRVVAGSYPHVAAGAVGVPKIVFDRWMREGSKGGNSRAAQREFWESVECAANIARSRAEMQLHKKDARAWLKNGPGRDLANYPGWSATPRAPSLQVESGASATSSHQLNLFMTTIRVALEPWPEAFESVSQAFEKFDSECKNTARLTRVVISEPVLLRE